MTGNISELQDAAKITKRAIPAVSAKNRCRTVILATLPEARYTGAGSGSAFQGEITNE